MSSKYVSWKNNKCEGDVQLGSYFDEDIQDECPTLAVIIHIQTFRLAHSAIAAAYTQRECCDHLLQGDLKSSMSWP